MFLSCYESKKNGYMCLCQKSSGPRTKQYLVIRYNEFLRLATDDEQSFPVKRRYEIFPFRGVLLEVFCITYFCWKEILLCSLLILRIKLKHHLKKVTWYWTNNARFHNGALSRKKYCLLRFKGCFKFQVMFHEHTIQSLWKLQLIIIIPPLRQGKNTDWRWATKWPHKTNRALPL